MENQLTTGSVTKKLVLFALPIFLANVLQAMYGTVDLMMVGLFSDAAAVSAVSTGSMTMQTLTSIITGLTMGATVFLGQNIGSEKWDMAAKTVKSAFVLFFIVALGLTVFTIFQANMIASFMNAPDVAFVSTIHYIQICGAGIIGIVFFNAISGIFRGIGDSKTPLILMAIACVMNIIGDFIFVEMMHMAASGAAFATIMAQLTSVLCGIVIIIKKGFGFSIKGYHPSMNAMVKILQFGFPIAMQEALTGLSFMVILAILNTFGVIASAGVGVAEKICALMFLVPSAAMASVSAFCAQNVGAKLYGRAKQAMKIAMLISVSIGTVMFVFSFFSGDVISSFFTSDQDVIMASADYLRSYSIDCILVGVSFCMMGYFNGHGKTSFVAIQGIICTFLVRIPVSYFMSQIKGVTLFEVGFATPLATMLGIVLCVSYYFYFQKNIKKK